jgi:hypothetical protein
MGRLETYSIAIVTLFLSLYGREIFRIFRRGWLRGRLNSLNLNLSQLEAMHNSVSYLITAIGYILLRAMLLMGFMVFESERILAWSQRGTSTGDFFVSLIFGWFCSELVRGMTLLHRAANHEAYVARTRRKIEVIIRRLEGMTSKPAS